VKRPSSIHWEILDLAMIVADKSAVFVANAEKEIVVDRKEVTHDRQSQACQ
jgi:hypothetical protein